MLVLLNRARAIVSPKPLRENLPASVSSSSCSIVLPFMFSSSLTDAAVDTRRLVVRDDDDMDFLVVLFTMEKGWVWVIGTTS